MLFIPVGVLAQTAPVSNYCVLGAKQASTSGLNSSNYLQGIIPRCTVTVYLTGTTTQAPVIYKDSANTPLTNPFTANADGSWLFYAPSGTGYDVVLSGGVSPNTYLIPVTLTNQSSTANFPSLLPVTTFGCVANSTDPAVMTANVACFNTILNSFGRYYLPGSLAAPQQFNINSCINVSGHGGFILEGAGIPASSIIQNTDGTCVIKFTNSLINEVVMKYMTIGHSNIQAIPVSETSDAPATAVLIAGPNGASFFRWEFDHVGFTKSSRGIGLSKATNQTVWAYSLNFLNAASDLQGATVNLIQSGAAGNPRIYMHQIFNTQVCSTEPCISFSDGFEVHLDQIEITPAGLSPAASWTPFIDATGSEDGTIENVHIENAHVGVGGKVLIAEENSNFVTKNISASIHVCIAGDACSGSSGNPATSFVSNLGGAGVISLRNVAMFLYNDSNTSSNLFGIRYGSNPNEADCDNFTVVGLGTGIGSCVEPASDIGRLTRNGPQFASIASSGAAASWAITSVATSSGGAAVYTGTFTACNTNANQRVLVSGFVATAANNGFFRVKSCTATALSVINGSAVSETHAATAVSGIGSIGFPNYSRFWTGAASQLVTCNPLVQPIYNPASTLWDTYLLNFCSNTQASSQLWTQHAGWDMVWTEPGNNNQELTVNNVGLSGLWRRGGLSPTDTFGAIPVMRGYRNVGGVFTAGDIRITADGSGFSLVSLCNATNTSFAIGSEAMQADQACSLMVGKSGDWYNQNGISTPVFPHTIAGTNGSAAGTRLPVALPWTVVTPTPICTDSFGNLNASVGCPAGSGSSIANIQITTGTTLIGANACTSSTPAAMTGVAVTSAIMPPTPTSDTSAIVGWGSSGGLSFTYFVTANTFNWRVCNSTASPITPGGSVVWNVGAR